MTWSFAIYFFFYCLPLCFILVNDRDKYHLIVLSVAGVVAIILFMIEIFQMFDQGWEYFKGWNIIDLW